MNAPAMVAAAVVAINAETGARRAVERVLAGGAEPDLLFHALQLVAPARDPTMARAFMRAIQKAVEAASSNSLPEGISTD